MFNSPLNGLFSTTDTVKKAFDFKTFLDGAERTLGLINQTIPIINQVKPVLDNAKTMFQIANELKTPVTRNDKINEPNIKDLKDTNNNINNDINKPIFYI